MYNFSDLDRINIYSISCMQKHTDIRSAELSAELILSIYIWTIQTYRVRIAETGLLDSYDYHFVHSYLHCLDARWHNFVSADCCLPYRYWRRLDNLLLLNLELNLTNRFYDWMNRFYHWTAQLRKRFISIW